MTDIERTLEEERRIINAATDGPWEWGQRTMGDELTKPTLLGDPNDPDPLRRAMAYGHPWNILKTTGDWRPTEGDAEFIAHARTALPMRNAQVAMAWEIVELLEQSAATARAAGDVRWQEDATRARMQGMAFAYDDARTALRRAIEEAGA